VSFLFLPHFENNKATRYAGGSLLSLLEREAFFYFEVASLFTMWKKK